MLKGPRDHRPSRAGEAWRGAALIGTAPAGRRLPTPGPHAATLASLAFEYSPVATIYTEHRIIRRANKAFAALFELPPDRTEGLTMEDFYPSRESSERVVDNAQGPLRATGHHADERTMQRLSGALFWCSVTGHSLTPDDPFAQIIWCFQDLSHQWDISELRPRDREIAILVCEGRTAKEMARLLNLSPRTVEAYLARIKHKLAVRNVAELVTRLRPSTSSVS